jgi:hypothetical protein
LPAQEAQAKYPESAAVSQLSVWVRTCDKSNAGTDGNVKVRFNSQEWFYLDRPEDDFERDSFGTYAVSTPTVTLLGDISRLEFKLSGNDGWCIESVYLLVNGSLVFAKTP